MSFLENYKKNVGEREKGIPYLEMNAPIAPHPVEGDVGIEMEIEGTRLINDGYLDGVVGEKSGAHWQRKEDGSLRGGYEYVTSGPVYEDEIEPLVTGFFERAESRGMVIRNSNRASTHVHVNVSRLKVNHLTSILALWSLFETAAINWCGEERTTNHFCLSTKDEDGVVEAWTQFLRTGNHVTEGGLKYSALNVLPLYRFGSFEFRCGMAPDNAQDVIDWAKFCNALAKYAATTYPNPHQVAYDVSERGATVILKDMCEKHNLSEQFYIDMLAVFGNDFDFECLRSFRTCQPFVLGFPWHDWQEEIDKAYVPNPFEPKTNKRNPRRGRR